MASTPDTAALVEGILSHDHASIASGLNLLDDRRPAATAKATELLSSLIPNYSTSTAHLIGMTGPPGVGKSSLTAALIENWRRRDLRVGVLAVDPSSPVSGGALLGDRLRMKTELQDDGVFVRSLSNRGQFGGLSVETWPMGLLMLCCFDIVLVETVGVGQREVDVANNCDTTCFVAQPGSGDSIQFLKAGVLEVPHLVVVNKSDLGAIASRTRTELGGALRGERSDDGWEIPILATSAINRSGIDELAEALERRHEHLLNSGLLHAIRRRNQAHWIVKRLEEEYGKRGLQNLGGQDKLLQALSNDSINPLTAYSDCIYRIENS